MNFLMADSILSLLMLLKVFSKSVFKRGCKLGVVASLSNTFLWHEPASLWGPQDLTDKEQEYWGRTLMHVCLHT